MIEAFSLGVGGELEEELLQPGTVRGPQLDEWDAGLVGHLTDSFGVGIRRTADNSRTTPPPLVTRTGPARADPRPECRALDVDLRRYPP